MRHCLNFTSLSRRQIEQVAKLIAKPGHNPHLWPAACAVPFVRPVGVPSLQPKSSAISAAE